MGEWENRTQREDYGDVKPNGYTYQKDCKRGAWRKNLELAIGNRVNEG